MGQPWFEAAHLQHIADPPLRSERARQWADGRRAELLKAGQSFVSETVFSHESKLALIQEAPSERLPCHVAGRGARPARAPACTRGPARERRGHPVPADRILARYPRTLLHLGKAVRLADAAILYDSQEVTPGTHTAVALCKRDWTQELVRPLPEWAQRVLSGEKTD